MDGGFLSSVREILIRIVYDPDDPERERKLAQFEDARDDLHAEIDHLERVVDGLKETAKTSRQQANAFESLVSEIRGIDHGRE